MNEWLKPLIQKASLEILDYDYYRRTEMTQVNITTSHCVLSYLKQGEVIFRVDGCEYLCKAGDAIFLPPHKTYDHIKISEEDAEFLLWHFNIKDAYDVDVFRVLHLPNHVKIENQEEFEKRFLKFLKASNEEQNFADMAYKKAKSLDVFGLLFEEFLSYAKEQVDIGIPGNFIDIFQEISKQPCADVTLKSLGEKFHMNPTYISNKFKFYFGISPMVLQKNMIFERAKKLLLSSEMEIREIAEQLRFTDQAIFTRFFSERAGMSPKQYRYTGK